MHCKLLVLESVGRWSDPTAALYKYSVLLWRQNETWYCNRICYFDRHGDLELLAWFQVQPIQHLSGPSTITTSWTGIQRVPVTIIWPQKSYYFLNSWLSISWIFTAFSVYHPTVTFQHNYCPSIGRKSNITMGMLRSLEWLPLRDIGIVMIYPSSIIFVCFLP